MGSQRKRCASDVLPSSLIALSILCVDSSAQWHWAWHEPLSVLFAFRFFLPHPVALELNYRLCWKSFLLPSIGRK